MVITMNMKAFWMSSKGWVLSKYIFFLLLCSYSLQGQSLLDSLFISPVDYKLKLSGSFGELRSNHFHTGIDIKSENGQGGDKIFAIADGYISRIKINRGGYGQAIYIDHPSGHTSVYAHLDSFNDSISSYISLIQEELESWEIDIHLNKKKLIVKQGEMIGILGNTGRSYGPHLHFEIRDTKSEKPINPFLFGIKPTDNKKPLVFSVDVYGLDYKDQLVDKKTKYCKEKNSGILDMGVYKINAWKAGIGVQVFDQMDGAKNYNGLYELKMEVDGQLMYGFKMDTLSFDQSRMINAHIQYECKMKEDRSVTKCYHNKCGKTIILSMTPTNGKIDIFQDKPRKVKISLIDLEQNITEVELDVYRTETQTDSYTYQKYLPCGQDSSFSINGTKFKFFDTSLAHDLPFNYIVEDNLHKISDRKYPLTDYIEVAIPIDTVIQNKEKLCLAFREKGKVKSFGGELSDGYLVTKINQFADFFIFQDTLPPSIIPEYFFTSSTTAKEFRFKLSDNLINKGTMDDFSYDVYIDNKWTACFYKSLDNLLIIPVNYLEKGIHSLRIEAQDYYQNNSVYEKKFVLN